jgi:hypothetical protein
MLMAPAMFMSYFDEAGRKASRHADCETEKQGNSEFSHGCLQAMLLSQENGATKHSIPHSFRKDIARLQQFLSHRGSRGQPPVNHDLTLSKSIRLRASLACRPGRCPIITQQIGVAEIWRLVAAERSRTADAGRSDISRDGVRGCGRGIDIATAACCNADKNEQRACRLNADHGCHLLLVAESLACEALAKPFDD